MKPYSVELLAYLAGCMDSDGYFTIRRDSRAMKTTGRSPTHVAMAGLRQVTPQVPFLLKEAFGGHLGITQSTAMNGRPLHGWHATAVKASTVCTFLMPHLRIKSAQAQVLIDLQARKGVRYVDGSTRVTSDEIAARDELWRNVKLLNRVGKDSGDVA